MRTAYDEIPYANLPFTQALPRGHATIAMLHGWSQDKTFWESDTAAGNGAGTWHWNNVWFVSKGWVVVNYTARGFQQSCGMTDLNQMIPAGSGWELSQGVLINDRGQIVVWGTRGGHSALGLLTPEEITLTLGFQPGSVS